MAESRRQSSRIVVPLATAFFAALSILSCAPSDSTSVITSPTSANGFSSQAGSPKESTGTSAASESGDTLASVPEDIWNEFLIDKLRPEMTTEAVESIYGKPMGVEKGKEFLNRRETTWLYDHFELGIVDAIVNTITLTDGAYSTFRGLAVGQDIQRIAELYGNLPVLAPDKEYPGIDRFSFDQDLGEYGFGSLVFFVKDWLIVKIECYIARAGE